MEPGVRVVIAPDSFGGTLSASDAAAAIAAGWGRARPDDELVLIGLSDGGEGFLDVVARPQDEVVEVEVADPLGQPITARWLRRGDTALVESALACGLALLPPDLRDPLATTTHGVGQLLEDARRAGATRIIVGLGGSATVDGGAGALTGLGFKLTMEDGSGLKVGGGNLNRLVTIDRGWSSPEWSSIEVVALADVATVLSEAAAVFGPQKGADLAAVGLLTAGLKVLADVTERDLDATGLASKPGSGAAGGLGYGLAAGIGALLRAGAPVVADEIGLDEHLRTADLVVTGEGRVDDTSEVGKVVSEVARRSHTFAVEMAIVAGSGRLPDGVDGVLTAPDGAGDDPAAEVAAAAQRLAQRRASPSDTA